MQTRKRVFFISLCSGIIILFAMPRVYAGFLVQPVLCEFEHIPVYVAVLKKTKPTPVKKNNKARHHVSKHFSFCNTSCRNNEIVKFTHEICAPRGGRFINLYECDNYNPDASTRDDDPMIHPGMNINN